MFAFNHEIANSQIQNLAKVFVDRIVYTGFNWTQMHKITWKSEVSMKIKCFTVSENLISYNWITDKSHLNKTKVLYSPQTHWKWWHHLTQMMSVPSYFQWYIIQYVPSYHSLMSLKVQALDYKLYSHYYSHNTSNVKIFLLCF